MYDLVIIGSGPAGLSAALSAKARRLDFLWLGSKALSPKIAKAERIMNYPGLSAISGEEMAEAFKKQMADADISIEEARIDSVYNMGKYFISCSNELMFEARTVILATGVSSGKEIKGEAEAIGRGLSCCATCDGNLYEGKEIAVVCTAKELEDEIEYLAGLAKKVTVFAAYKDYSTFAGNIVLRREYPNEIVSDEHVRAIVSNGETIPVDGVFILRESISPAALMKGLETDGAHIVVDRAQRTSIEGVFAAGDCTGRPYQYTKAVGEGNVALHSAIEYLNKLKKA